jgi:Mg2+ and Co2+ transporter CorA
MHQYRVSLAALTALAIASAANRPAPPVISITTPQDDFFDPDTRSFLQDWESRYSNRVSAVSQAEFFAPKELLTDEDASTSSDARFEDDDVPLHPSAPRIVISEPDTIFQVPSSLEENSTLRVNKRIAFLSAVEEPLQATPRLRQRRHSTISLVPEHKTSTNVQLPARDAQPRPTPRPWTTTETHPKNGWKMRVRYAAGSATGSVVDVIMVYLYNSAMSNQLDRDADLAIFNHYEQPEPLDRETSPTRKIQRARTELGKQSRQDIVEFSKPSNWAPQQDAQRLRHQPVNFLKDANMLREQVPGMRLTTVGFDVKPSLVSNFSYEAAAQQLYDHLQRHRSEHTKVPIIFLGHTLGGVFIIKALAEYQADSSVADAMFADTAGLFLFSTRTTFSESQKQALADLYGAKPTDRSFIELLQGSVAHNISKAAKGGFCTKYPRTGVQTATQTEKNGTQHVSIGFPIFQVLARGEAEDALGSVLSTPVRTMTIGKEPSNCLKFTGSLDQDFIHLSMLIQSALQTHRLLQAAALGRADDIHSMIRRGTNVNLRDRWSQTALQIAVRLNHEKVVLKLLGAKNVDPNPRDKLSNTPLHYAVRTGNETIVRALIHNGADISIENQRKRTPRDLAEKQKSRKHISKLLKSKLMSGPDQSPSSKLIGSGKPPTSQDAIMACRNSQITVTEIYATRNSDKHWSVSVSVEALLYGTNTLDDILDQVRPQLIKAETPACTWIHVPENNMVWLEDLFAKLRLHPAIWQDTKRSVTESLRNRAITPHYNVDDTRSLFLPYLSYEANLRQAKRITHIQTVDATYQQARSAELPFATSALAALTDGSSRTSAGERKPLLQVPAGKNLESYPYLEEDSDSDFSEIFEPDDPDDLEEEEKALINAYLYNPPALHVRRTLDQYYYHMLESTHERDIDQVVSRWARKVKSAPNHNILMVDQLWLWTCHNRETAAPGEHEMEMLRRRDHNSDRTKARSTDTSRSQYVVSCFPTRTGSDQLSHRTLDDLRLHVLDPSSRKRDPIRQPEDLVSRILEICCSVFDRMQDVDWLRFYQMFEDSVGTIDDKESKLFREFQRGSNRLLELDNNNKYYNESKHALLTDLLDIRTEIALLVEIKDIRDEVNIILTVLNIQRKLVDQMSQPVREETALLRTPVVKNLILADVNDFTKLDSQARTIQEKLNTLMDLKQKAANAWEAKEARETAVAAGKQGNTVLVFTVVTIIFLPLSFMSSFFAIGIAAFPHNEESGEVNWPLGTVMGLLFGVSLCVSIPLILFALNMDYFTSIYKELRNNYLAGMGIKLIPLLPPLGSSSDPTAYRRRWTGLLQKQREDYMKNDDLAVACLGMGNGDFADVKPGVSFPSTASSHTFIEKDESDSSSHTRTRHRGFRPRRKTPDDESLVGS